MLLTHTPFQESSIYRAVSALPESRYGINCSDETQLYSEIHKHYLAGNT